MSKTFFTSDLHFGHKNVMKYDNRPFVNIEEMDLEMIKQWNSEISDEDTVYILGDISWYNTSKTIEIYNKLNGQKHLIIGNHDHKLIKSENVRKLFCEIVNYKELKIDNQLIVLSHYPIMFWNGQHKGSILCYGHIHNSAEENYFQKALLDYERVVNERFKAINVGCMLNDYKPINLEKILK